MKERIKLLSKVIFVFLLLLCSNVFSQYYYFDSGGNVYQQGCDESLKVRINSEGQDVRAGRFHLILDPLTTIYPKVTNVSELRSFVIVSAQTFINWTSENSPSWKENSNYTILQIDRNNGVSDYSGISGLYATINFVPVFSGVSYDVVFGMEYLSGDATNETTLSKEGGIELIDPEHQNLYRTGVFHVLQEPCIDDTNNPTITNLSITNNSSKISYLSGLTFSLIDNGGVNGVSNVPYVFTDLGWTGNEGGVISNQYGIDLPRFLLVLSGVSQKKTITSFSSGVNVSRNGKTWQNSGLNVDFSLSPDALFDFGIEKKVSATFIFYDRAGNTGTQVIYFNAPKGPMLISNSTSPANGDVYVNLNAPIKLGIQDDWAGVNSGTIKVILSGLYGTDYGPYTFSGNSLNLSGVQGLANQPDYYVSIYNHVDFPTSGKINVSVYAEDMEGNADIISDYSFSTRPNCSEFQCCDPVSLDLGGQNVVSVSNTGLIISGGDSVNFYVSGDVGIIECNAENLGISVYSGNDMVFFTDEDILNIVGPGVKGVLSGDTLVLSYLVQSAEVVVDTLMNLPYTFTGDFDMQWYVTGVENVDENDWLSGFVIQIYDNSGNFITGGFIDNTGIVENLEDGYYDFELYPIDLWGHTGNSTTGNFVVDTVLPVCTIEIINNECTTGDIQIKLLGDIQDIYSYQWWDGTTGSFNSSVFKVVNENGLYTGIVYDIAGNVGICSGEVMNYDVLGPDIVSLTGTVEECKGSTIQIIANDGCSGVSGYYFGDEFGNSDWQSLDTLSITVDSVGRTGGIGKSQFIMVNDHLGNVSTGQYYFDIINVSPELSTGNYNYGLISESIVDLDVIDILGANEGSCGTGDLVVELSGCEHSTGVVNGNKFSLEPEIGFEGTGGCEFLVRDNENSGVTGYITFAVDTKKPECLGLDFNQQWSSGADILASLTGCSEVVTGDVSHVFTGNDEYLFVFEDLNGNTGKFLAIVTGFDFDPPTFVFENNSGFECETGSLVISNAVDTGIGLLGNPYSFDGINWIGSNIAEIYLDKSGVVVVTGYVRDGLGNQSMLVAEYKFVDSPLTATGFSIYALNGISFDWKVESDAKDGSCGSGGLIATVSGGNIGVCAISGEILSYTPHDPYVTGIDYCDMTIIDDEGNEVVITVEFTGVNKYPYVNIVSPVDGAMSQPGDILFSWVAEGDSGSIVKYYYRIWNDTEDIVIEQTGTSLSRRLDAGNYFWEIYAEFIDGTTGGLSKTYSINMISQSSNGGGGGGHLRKDNCPDGDYSDSYYDGMCSRYDNGGSHNSANYNNCGVDIAAYSDEQKLAYLYAYNYGITTKCPIDEASLDGYLIRSHFAKMISEFAVNVVGIKPNKLRTGCDKFNDIRGLDTELHNFVITSCELGLMGLQPDGENVLKSFNPDDYVTRAQFGTVLSRLLFGDMYNIDNDKNGNLSWYYNHLQALKNYGIMTKIDGDWPNYLERRGRVMIMLQRSDDYGIFAGKVPANNGIIALFE